MGSGCQLRDTPSSSPLELREQAERQVCAFSFSIRTFSAIVIGVLAISWTKISATDISVPEPSCVEMEGDANQMSQATLCRSGCGFYGNPASDGLCSKCYKDALKRKQSTPPLAAAATGRGSPSGSSASESSTPELTSSMTTTTATTTVPVTTMTNTSLCQDTEQETSEKSPTELGSDGASACSETMDTDSSQDMLDLSLRDQKKKKNRCLMCRKKVGLTGFECRCGGLFCSLHRYSDKHSCTFDYKELGAQEIRKNNPIVVGEKIQKI